MDQQTRTLLKAEIEVYLAKFPDASVNQVLKSKLCKKMIDSLPVRAQAVISKNGRQIFKKDYQ